MKTDDEIILSALERELKRLTDIAVKIKAKTAARLNAGTKILEIQRETIEVLNGKVNDAGLARLKELDSAESEARKLLKFDIIKILDKEYDAESERDSVARVLASHRFAMGFRKGRK